MSPLVAALALQVLGRGVMAASGQRPELGGKLVEAEFGLLGQGLAQDVTQLGLGRAAVSGGAALQADEESSSRLRTLRLAMGRSRQCRQC
jgi:hypothetical protein